MRSRGQVFSLDFVLAATLSLFLLAMVFQYSELVQYSVKEKQLTEELYSVGTRASLLLSSNPSLNCLLVEDDTDDKVITHLSDCLTIRFKPLGDPDAQCPSGRQTTEDGFVVSKQALGIPTGFDCSLSGSGEFEDQLPKSQGVVSDCRGTPPEGESVFSVEKNTVVFINPTSGLLCGDSTISKADFLACVDNSDLCVLERATILLKVWKES